MNMPDVDGEFSVSARGRRVLFVTSSFPRHSGDATTPFVSHLATDLRRLGWEIDVLAPHAPGAARTESLDGILVRRFRYMWPESAQTVCYGGDVQSRLRRRPLDLAKLPPLVAAEAAATWRRLPHYDLVHSHWLLPQGFAAGLASRLRSVPHVATVHGSDVFGLRGTLLVWFKRAAIAMADVVTANSSATADALRALRCPQDRLVRIPMGAGIPGAVDPGEAAALARRLRRGAEGPLVVFVGRLTDEKGASDLVEALAIARDRLPGIAAAVVGDGPERAGLEALVRQIGLEDRVTFAGWQPPVGVALHLAAADWFVGPSRTAATGSREAQGLVFAEAMLAGRPVIATRSGGISDLVRDGVTGLLVDERAPEQIAAALIRLAENPLLAERLRTEASAAVRREHTREASARAFAGVYARLLEADDRSKMKKRANVRS